MAEAKPYGGGSISFKADGTFTARHFVYEPLDGDRDYTGFGTWRFDHNDDRQVIDLTFRQIGRRPYVAGYGLQLEIAGKPGHRTLYMFRGDPDAWDTLDLRRAEIAPGS